MDSIYSSFGAHLQICLQVFPVDYQFQQLNCWSLEALVMIGAP